MDKSITGDLSLAYTSLAFAYEVCRRGIHSYYGTENNICAKVKHFIILDQMWYNCTIYYIVQMLRVSD